MGGNLPPLTYSVLLGHLEGKGRPPHMGRSPPFSTPFDRAYGRVLGAGSGAADRDVRVRHLTRRAKPDAHVRPGKGLLHHPPGEPRPVALGGQLLLSRPAP